VIVARDNFGYFLGNTRKSSLAAGSGSGLGASDEFTQKRRIAEHLHRQGIDPEKWASAEQLP
jgi:hypothetical protein